MKPNSQYTAEQVLTVFNAAHLKSSVRLDADGMFSGVLHVFDGKQQFSMRLEGSTLICLADVMARWLEKQPHPPQKGGET